MIAIFLIRSCSMLPQYCIKGNAERFIRSLLLYHRNRLNTTEKHDKVVENAVFLVFLSVLLLLFHQINSILYNDSRGSNVGG
jgi:hypothetical protein